MNKKITSIVIAFAFFTLSCRQSPIKESSTNSVFISGTSREIESVPSILQHNDSSDPYQTKATSKKRSRCIGAPSRFSTNAQLASPEPK